MIQANELRIGNILEYFVNENGVDWIKVKVNGWDILRCDDNPTSFNGVRRPVVLTPEILERAGFTKVTDGSLTIYSYGTNPVTSDWVIQLKWLKGYPEPFYQNGHFKVAFVHQLQNLIFALCGTELDINL
jgi:hypothetical protein